MGNAPGQRLARARLLLVSLPVMAGLADAVSPYPFLPVVQDRRHVDHLFSRKIWFELSMAALAG